ncbi:CHAT domain-containing protein [Rhodocyclus purpureus]|uniref:CHAT domain-containing protein n=1 Tax=Rhodocyclus purpureus TaxID=1067 RepID=UPI001912800B|nr:CHAT domain-containing protein [Rhodocyclus purpureus]MBK5913922.1 hypothetical protein [Rhodocyclus purpureus]
MNSIHGVTLELVRAGPAHNQLLSPLTPYIALCGGDSPVSVHLPFEHHQLLLRLQRLRYEAQENTPSEAQSAQRQGELLDMGRLLGDVLGSIPALLAELSRARCQGGQLVHLRLSLSASELGMVPFETAISPAGFPGFGSPLFLQSNTPVSITREIRRGRPLPLDWNRRPKILFAFASPPEYPPVPAEQHLRALHEAIKPWLKMQDDAQGRLKEIKQFLTVLPDASLQEIRKACTGEHFTHVHILAHGAPISIAGDRRYGVALCQHDDRAQPEFVDGESLAFTLTGKDAAGDGGHVPTLVSLSTCDSGNLNSTLTPGGSVAHALHAAGIPWVIASQFPLWMRASAIATRELFSGILNGEDPRWVLYGLRQKLRTDCPNTHDWASIVAYATLPDDFVQQVQRFRDEQMKARLDVKLDQLDRAIKRVNPESADRLLRLRSGSPDGDASAARPPLDELAGMERETDAELQRWLATVGGDGGDCKLKAAAAQRLARCAAWKKRLGVAYATIAPTLADAAPALAAAQNAYRASRDHYLDALEQDPASTWLATQFLALNAVTEPAKTPARMPMGIDEKDLWLVALKLARGETRRGQDEEKAWALTTVVELCLLGARYSAAFDPAGAAKEIEDAIHEIRRLEGRAPMPAKALEYQLRRYHRQWRDERWDALVEVAVQTLHPDGDSPSGLPASGGGEASSPDLARQAGTDLDSPVASVAPGDEGAEPCQPTGEREGPGTD